MANAERDQNFVPTLIVALSTNGTTIVRVKADASSHGLMVSDAATGSDHGPVNALRDDNFVPTLLAVSSLDGVTPVVVYADSSGNLLVDSS